MNFGAAKDHGENYMKVFWRHRLLPSGAIHVEIRTEKRASSVYANTPKIYQILAFYGFYGVYIQGKIFIPPMTWI